MCSNSLLSVCSRTPVCRVSTEVRRDLPPSMAIVEALATADGIDTLTLESLYTVVDAEALDRLFAHRARLPDGERTIVSLTAGEKIVCVGDGTDVCVCDHGRDADGCGDAGGDRPDGCR